MARADGKRATYIDPMTQLMPYIMKKTYDAQNFAKLEVSSAPIEAFIARQRAKGEDYSFNDVILASIVRLYSRRPELNRFIVGKKIYDRYDMTVAFVIKKGLKESGAETMAKLDFDGSETIKEIKDRFRAVVLENNRDTGVNSLDLLMDKLTRCPTWIMNAAVGMLTGSDKHGLMPRSVLAASPFHASCCITFLKSIKCDYVYHHIYDFGTVGMFFSVGKEKITPVVTADGEVRAEKGFTIGITMDERFMDGLYMANTLRMWSALLSNPDELLDAGEKTFSKEIVTARVKEKTKEKKIRIAELKKRLKEEKKNKKKKA